MNEYRSIVNISGYRFVYNSKNFLKINLFVCCNFCTVYVVVFTELRDSKTVTYFGQTQQCIILFYLDDDIFQSLTKIRPSLQNRD